MPGSWPPKSLAGNATIVKPASAFSSYSAWSAVYCGVSPQAEATLTTRTTSPAWSPRVVVVAVHRRELDVADAAIVHLPWRVGESCGGCGA